MRKINIMQKILFRFIIHVVPTVVQKYQADDDDEGRINFSMALSPKTTRTRNNKLKPVSYTHLTLPTNREV